MYLCSAFVSGWVKRRRGKVVAVGIVTVIVIVIYIVEWWGLDKNSIKLGDMCWWGGHQQCRVDIIQVFFIWLFLLFVFTSTIVLMG